MSTLQDSGQCNIGVGDMSTIHTLSSTNKERTWKLTGALRAALRPSVFFTMSCHGTTLINPTPPLDLMESALFFLGVPQPPLLRFSEENESRVLLQNCVFQNMKYLRVIESRLLPRYLESLICVLRPEQLLPDAERHSPPPLPPSFPKRSGKRLMRRSSVA